MWLRAALFGAALAWVAAVGGVGRSNAVLAANAPAANQPAVESAPRLPLPSEPPAPVVDARTVWLASAGIVVVLIVGRVLFVHRREHSLPHPPPARS